MRLSTFSAVRWTCVLVGVVATLLLPPTAGAASQRGFEDLRIATDRAPALPTISPPPRLHAAMHWYRWHPSTRSLLARLPEFGSAAVLGVESMRDLPQLRARFGFVRVETFPALHAAEVSVDSKQLHALLATAASDPRIRYVAPLEPPRHLERLRNDPMLRTLNPKIDAPYEWEFGASHVDAALNLTPGSPTVLVGIIDSGVADIPDLTDKIASRWYYTGRVDSGDDLVGHGTAVASIIAANNDDGFGMAGFGGATRVISFRDDILSDESIAIAATKLVSLGVRIINISAGGRRASSPLLQDAVQKAITAGVLVVGSAGNDGLDVVSYPASNLQPPGGGLSYGLAVGATNFDGTRAAFSNQGTHLSLVAPGNYLGGCYGVLLALSPIAHDWDGSCYPTFPGDGGARYTYAAGTSFSAPEVSGAAALVWAAAPLLKNFEVAEILKRSAHHPSSGTWNTSLGWGVLDVAAALEDATGRSSADVLSITDFAFDRGAGAQRHVTARGRVAWADSVPPDTATTVSCAASVNGSPLHVVEQTLVAGALRCAWAATAGIDGQTATGTVTVTDVPTGVVASLPFTTPLGDLSPPAAHALAASGSWGHTVGLPFTGSDAQGEVAAQIVVKRETRTLAHLQGGFFRIHAGKNYSFAWKAPARKIPGAFTFCLTLADRTGNRSAKTCAPIRLS